MVNNSYIYKSQNRKISNVKCIAKSVFLAVKSHALKNSNSLKKSLFKKTI